MIVGVDFDNTIVCCDPLFHQAALERGLIPPSVPDTKGQVRDFLRQQGQEDAWTELQGYVYGVLLPDAPVFPGALQFFARCRQLEVGAGIISHKTRYPYLGQAYDLHQAAQDWLRRQGFYDPDGGGLSPSQVCFEHTKEAKLRRIAQMECTHFIDDLPEFLLEPGFPPGVERILFDPNGEHPDGLGFPRAASWMEIEQWLLRQRAAR